MVKNNPWLQWHVGSDRPARPRDGPKCEMLEVNNPLEPGVGRGPRRLASILHAAQVNGTLKFPSVVAETSLCIRFGFMKFCLTSEALAMMEGNATLRIKSREGVAFNGRDHRDD